MSDFKADNIDIAYNILLALSQDVDLKNDLNCIRDKIHADLKLSDYDWKFIYLDEIVSMLTPRNVRDLKRPCRPNEFNKKAYLVLYAITAHTKLFDNISYYINKYYTVEHTKHEATKYTMKDVCNLLKPDVEGLSYKGIIEDLPSFKEDDSK